MDELDRAIRSEKDPKARERLRAVRGVRKFGYSVAEVALYNDVSTKTVRNWLNRYDEAGPDNMQDLPKSGRPAVVTLSQVEKIARRLFKKGDLTTASLQDALHRETGTRFHESYIRKLLRKIDFTSKLPDTVHAKAASDEECDSWYSKTIRKMEYYASRGFIGGIEDEFILSMIAKGRRRRWGPRNVKLRLLTTGSRRKKVGYLTIFDNGRHIFRFKEKFNSDAFIEYLSEVMRKYKKVFLIVDGARQHFSAKVKEFVRKQKGNLILWPLPPASPHMSCVEKSWSNVRGATEAKLSYLSLEEKMADVSKYFRTTKLHLNMYDYLERRLGPGKYI